MCYNYIDDYNEYAQDDNSNYYNENNEDYFNEEDNNSIDLVKLNKNPNLVIIFINLFMFAITTLVLKFDERTITKFKMTVSYFILVLASLMLVEKISLALTSILVVFYIGWTWNKSNKMPCCDKPEEDLGPDVFVRDRRRFQDNGIIKINL